MSHQSLARMSHDELLHRRQRLRIWLLLTGLGLLGFTTFLLWQLQQQGEISVLIPGGGALIAVSVSLISRLRHIEAELKRRARS